MVFQNSFAYVIDAEERKKNIINVEIKLNLKRIEVN